MEEYKPQQEKEVTFENTIFVGNKINLEGERYEITSMKHEGKARSDGGYYAIDLKNLAPGKEDMIKSRMHLTPNGLELSISHRALLMMQSLILKQV